MAGWWPFGSSQKAPPPEPQIKSEYDAYIPPPPSGSPFAPPPDAPKWLQEEFKPSLGESFKGFSPPPPTSRANVSDVAKGSSSYFNFNPKNSQGEESYSPDDLQKFASSLRESNGLMDSYYAQAPEGNTLSKRILSGNPRAYSCFENVKMGLKTGGAVGGIFGLITGGYLAVTNRNLWLLPITMVGGAITFGFFVGCATVVRCDELKSAPSLSELSSLPNRTPFRYHEKTWQ